LLGGFLTTYLSWRIGFLLEAVIIAIVLSGLGLVKDAPYTGERKIDLVGAAHINRVSALAGPLAAVLDGADDDQRAAMRRTATDLAAPFLADGGLEIPGRALLLSGRR
jgi:MFS family permease